MTTPVSHGERVAYGVVAVAAGVAMYRFRRSLVKVEHSSMGRSGKGWFARGSTYWRVRERVLQYTGLVLAAAGVLLIVTGLLGIG